LNIMPRLFSATTPPLFESAMRLTLRYLSAPSAVPSTYEELEGEQSRIRRGSRHGILG
jgi:hypothetical protein